MSKQKIDIIGKRVIVKISEDVVESLLVLLIGIGLTIYFLYTYEFLYAIIAGIICLFLFCLSIKGILKKIKNNSNLMPTIALREDGAIILYDVKGSKTYIAKDDIILNIKAKVHKRTVITPMFFSETTYNYGKIIIKFERSSGIRCKKVVEFVLHPTEVVSDLYSIILGEESLYDDEIDETDAELDFDYDLYDE